MNTPLLAVHVLTCLVVLNVLSVSGQSTCCPTENCCDDNCVAPPPFNITLAEMVSMQPLYGVMYPQASSFAGLDNVCYTFIPLPDGTYLLDINRVYVSPGFNTTESYTITMDEPGVYPAGSATCRERITIFDYLNTKDCSVYLGYVCFDYGNCLFGTGNSNAVFALSRNRTQISNACMAELIDLINRDGVTSQKYITLPMKLPSGCVTKIC